MNFCISSGSGCTCITCNNAKVYSFYIHFQETCSTHIKWLFLYPKPNCFAVLFIKCIELVLWQRIQLLQSYNGHIFPIFFGLFIGQLKINFTCTQQYFFNSVGILYKYIIQHLFKTTISKLTHAAVTTRKTQICFW